MNFRLSKKRHLRLGHKGENLACRLLKEKNYDILCRNYKVKSGEIDIVARDGGILVFTEVKTMRYHPLARPAANLKTSQKQRIVHAAQNYLRAIGNPDVTYRFDLIEVVLSTWRIHSIRHWQEHFSSRDGYNREFRDYDYT
jgi:putative endonuclease